MFKRLLTVMLVCLLALGAVIASSGSASAAAPKTRAQLAKAASAVEYEKVGGSLYGKYKKAAGYKTQLNWIKDGCSVPTKALVIAGLVSPVTLAAMLKYEHTFVHSCDRHDFGYRNYGKNTSTPGPHLKLNPTQARKNSIDAKFYSNMQLTCAGENFLIRPVCKVAAKGFYLAVSKTSQGHKAFFG